MKNLFQDSIKNIKSMILRGPILSFWVKKKIKSWQKNYLKRVAKLIKPVKKEKQTTAQKSLRLKSFLIICDEMWEANELLPEIKKITPTILLDIKKYIKEDRIDLIALGTELRTQKNVLKFSSGLLYLNGKWLSDDLFASIKTHLDGPLLCMNLDDKAEFFYFGPGKQLTCGYRKWIKKFDLNLSSSILFKTFYENHGGRFFYCPPGLHIPRGWLFPRSNLIRREICFLGSAKPERMQTIRALKKVGFRIETLGAGWPEHKWIDKPRKVFQSSQINLGFGFASGSDNITSIKARDFECPGIGSCYLTSFNFELCNHWDIGQEILCYRSFEELVEMLSFYLKKPEICLKIAQAAFARAIKEHTWETRFKKVFRELGFVY